MLVYQLLGGKTVDAIDLGLCSGGPADQLIEEARKGSPWLRRSSQGQPRLRSAVRGARAVREALGDDIRLMMDVNGMWNYDQSLKYLRRMERENVNLELIEQPMPYWDIEGMARLREKVGTPIYADESARELQHLKEIIDRRAADGLFIKVQKAGGLLKSQRWLTLARLSGLPVMCGCMPARGGAPAAHPLVADHRPSAICPENCGLTIHDTFEIDGPLETWSRNAPRYVGAGCTRRKGLASDRTHDDFIASHISSCATRASTAGVIRPPH